jgi:hypothetical protein
MFKDTQVQTLYSMQKDHYQRIYRNVYCKFNLMKQNGRHYVNTTDATSGTGIAYPS